jgi:competence protein ComFC
MIGKLIAQLMYYCCSIPNCDYITYVPLHTTKQNRRGFNQSEEIAQHLSTLLNKPIIHLLTKNKAGISQMSIKDKNIRINNLEGTINYLGNINIDNKKILIVDDIYTTGSTLNYCAKIIKMNTINTSVSAICFAHRS